MLVWHAWRFLCLFVRYSGVWRVGCSSSSGVLNEMNDDATCPCARVPAPTGSPVSVAHVGLDLYESREERRKIKGAGESDGWIELRWMDKRGPTESVP